jgi:cytochrome bd ubiquinol oxidase subunit II
VLHADAPVVFDGLKQGWGFLFALFAAAATVLTAGLVHQGVLRATRLTVIAALTGLVLAWGSAQNHYLLPTTMTIEQGAGDSESLRWLVFVTIVGCSWSVRRWRCSTGSP